MDSHDAFLAEVETFLTETGMPPTAFGREVLRDGNFVSDLRKGRSPNLKVAQRVLEFIRERRVAGSPGAPRDAEALAS